MKTFKCTHCADQIQAIQRDNDIVAIDISKIAIINLSKKDAREFAYELLKLAGDEADTIHVRQAENIQDLVDLLMRAIG
jgi:hypothetical protein